MAVDNATNRWLNALAKDQQAALETVSDYRLAKLLDVPTATISNYRRGVRGMDDDIALRLADLIGVHPMRVIGEIRAERSRDSRMSKLWTQVAKNAKKTGTATAVILAASLGALSPPKIVNWEGEFTSPALAENAPEPCILCKVERTRRGRRFRRKNRPSIVPGRIRELSFQLAA